MNIFFLNPSPVKAAQLQCDRHVVKMTLETAQLLCTAHQVLDGEDSTLYRITHKNHPSAIWARETSSNYCWLYEHFIALCNEYTFRYDKTHLTEIKFADRLATQPQNIVVGPMTKFPLAMPDEFKSEDLVSSYQKFYLSKKQNFEMRWTKRKQPSWFH